MPKITKFVKPTGETITIIPFKWGLDEEEVRDIQFHLLPEPIQVILQARLEFALGWYCEDNEHLFDLLDNKFIDRGYQMYNQHKHTVTLQDRRNRWINLQNFLTSAWSKAVPS